MNLIRQRLDSLNKPNLYIYITGDVPKQVRKLARKKFNKDETKILLITRAGSEGLDLKGVRNIIIMESNWNASADAQIIGRGIRYKSHLHLPEEDRNVTIHRILLHKPQGNNDIMKSIDDILYTRAYEIKLPLIKEYLNIIKNNSIESHECNCRLGDGVNNPIGCQSIAIPDISQKEKDEKSNKVQYYEAPSGITSIAITVDEVSRRLFQKLAGLGAKRSPSSEEEDINIEDISMESELGDDMGSELGDEDITMESELVGDEEVGDDYVDEYAFGSEQVDYKNIRESLDVEEDIEEQPEIVIEDEDF
jgi:hypothetical protein